MQEITKQLQDNLSRHINKHIYDGLFSETYRYSLLPPGKMFRPLMVWAISQDFCKDKTFSDAHSKLASFVEVHHTYTLIHDDMPCMDDDEIRRGKASTHAKFGQWQALLCGDGLLNASYALLASMDTKNLSAILKYSTWALGPKGLILGQALDLSGEMTKSIDDLILTHRLKTARLIQTCLICSFLLIEKDNCTVEKNFKSLKGLHRLGDSMGITFQLLDDLCELVDEELSVHEAEVNPWPKYPEVCFSKLESYLSNLEEYFSEFGTVNIQRVYAVYLEKIKTLLLGSQSTIENHIGIKLDPVITRLNSLC